MIQGQEQRWIYYDKDLKIEAYNPSGVVQKFPNHFREYYAIGFVKGGKRHLWSRNREHDISAGNLIFFDPKDNHYCVPIDGEPLDYHAISIDPSIMGQAIRKITGREFTPRFTRNVVCRSGIIQPVSALYGVILWRATRLEKEETLFFLLEQMLQKYATLFKEEDISRPGDRIQDLCTYMKDHFSEDINLDELLSMATSGKSYLLRSFTKQVGVLPYWYLQTIRLDKAKEFLEQGMSPMEAAAMAGFSDQSRFTNFFKEFIRLAPRQYQKILLSRPNEEQKGHYHES